METLNRLAGVQEASSPQLSEHNEPFSEPQDPVGSDPTTPHLSRRPSRASLPLNQRASIHSLNGARQRSRSRQRSRERGPPRSDTDSPAGPADTNKPHPPLPTPSRMSGEYRRSSGSDGRYGEQENENGRDTQQEDEEDDFTWGPNHPCFPHPNPYCARDSHEYASTRVIRVRKDWLAAGDLYPQFANLYPEILDPLVSDSEFRLLVTSLNSRLKDAFDPRGARAMIDAVMGVATGYLWDDMGLAGSKRGVKGIETLVDDWNRRKKAEGVDVQVVQIRKSGFMTLDFIVPDPGIDRVDAEDEEPQLEGGIGPAE